MFPYVSIGFCCILDSNSFMFHVVTLHFLPFSDFRWRRAVVAAAHVARQRHPVVQEAAVPQLRRGGEPSRGSLPADERGHRGGRAQDGGDGGDRSTRGQKAKNNGVIGGFIMMHQKIDISGNKI